MTDVALGIDLGLTGARAALVRADGRVLARSGPARAADGDLGDAGAWPGAVADAVTATLNRVPSVRPGIVCVTAAGCRPVLVDERMRPLVSSRLAALDPRPAAERRRLAAQLGLPAGELADHALPQLLWLREHAASAFQRAAYALDSTGFLVGWLTGEAVIDHITAADYALPGIDLPLPIPPPRDPLAIAGALTSEAAGELGLDAGTPVTVGTYDSYVDLHSMAGGPGTGSILLGTTMVVAVATELEAGTDAGQLRVVEAPGGGRLLAGWTSAAGATVAWAREQFGDRDIRGIPPGGGGLLATPYLNGERTPVWDPAARGLVLGLTTRTSAAQLQRAFMDAVVLSGRDLVERVRRNQAAPAAWRVSGGGIHDPAWLAATSDALRSPLDVVDITGGVGAAVFGLRAAGAQPAVPVVRTEEPDPERAGRFDALYPLYLELYPRLSQTMHALGELDDSYQ